MTKVWDYGDEGRAHPVAVGQTWAIGRHRFHCSDLMSTLSFDSLVHSAVLTLAGLPAVLYSDPPWGQSLVNSFRTKAGLQHATYRWEELYSRIAKLGHAERLPVWVEGSKADHRDGRKIPATIAAYLGAPRPLVTAYVELVYYGKNPMGLYYAGVAQPPLNIESMRGVDDDHTPGMVMKAYGSAGLVIDPCAGRGQTSREAERTGWTSVNNELNPMRVSAALVRMQKLTGETPVRVA